MTLSTTHSLEDLLLKALTDLQNSYTLQPISLSPTNSPTYYAFLSFGLKTQRAKVYRERATTLENLAKRLIRRFSRYTQTEGKQPDWLKVDVISSVESIPYKKFERLVARTRKNYFRKGISFDKDFSLAFLEQEINGNAFLRTKDNRPIQLDPENVRHYLNYREENERIIPFSPELYRKKDIYLFETQAFFLSLDSKKVLSLQSGGALNGVRFPLELPDEIHELIDLSTTYLGAQLQKNGKFQYGFFAPFDKKIGTYNILRHSSSLYALLEGIEITKDESLLPKIHRGLTYMQSQVLFSENDEAFVKEATQQDEIKLGANATAILAIAKYCEVTRDKSFLPLARQLANGILAMQKEDGKFIHVYTPSLEVKEEERIIYYEGEAVFALLRLYAIDSNSKWLEAAKKTFDYFVEHDYHTYHDHWLGYATNELTTYLPEDRYFEFGLKNGFDNLSFIYKRETTFPTFLELMMATYKLVDRIKNHSKDYLLKDYSLPKLQDTIEHRVNYQRSGFFYPEVAMYMKNPERILHGFFIKHHSFRVRIDDVEHYLSGYCQAYHHLKNL